MQVITVSSTWEVNQWKECTWWRLTSIGNTALRCSKKVHPTRGGSAGVYWRSKLQVFPRTGKETSHDGIWISVPNWLLTQVIMFSICVQILHQLNKLVRVSICAADNSVGGGPVKITVQHVQGTFFILIIGLFISGLVFLGEITSSRRANHKLWKRHPIVVVWLLECLDWTTLSFVNIVAINE